MTMTTEASIETQNQQNIINMPDEELLAIAHPMWEDLIKYSNKGQYGKFIKKFSYNLLFGLNEVEVGKQFAKSELTRSLSEDYDYLGTIRRGEHVTILYRVRSKKKEGEWLGRMVLGYEDGEVRIFGASIF
nr:hypothetical protein [Thiohalophilus sp.]